MYALFARLYGNNNLPDSSNMCHESTSVALPESIGVPVGTVTLEDFKDTDCIFFFGQNVGSNSPRMLHNLQDAVRRGVPIVTFNSLRERGLVEFINPQAPGEMLTGTATPISSQYHQVKAGGDIAALYGLCKALLEVDDRAKASGGQRVVDETFIAEHTHGFEDFVKQAGAQEWADLEKRSGLTRGALEAAATVYAHAGRVIGIYGMGLTQHRKGVETVQMLANLLLLRGNFGKPGAGICPVRGHSNVQGQRTVGISEKPELVPLDKLERQFSFKPPREKGLNTVEACEKILSGEVRAVFGLGGQYDRSCDPGPVAWSLRGVSYGDAQVATKPNRSHLIHGDRLSSAMPGSSSTGKPPAHTSRDGGRQHELRPRLAGHAAAGERASSRSRRRSSPESPRPRCQPIQNRLGRLGGRLRQGARGNRGDLPGELPRLQRADGQPGGFHRHLPARHPANGRPTGKANFIVPAGLETDPNATPVDHDVLRLITLRSNDQFNTTIYRYKFAINSDPLRGGNRVQPDPYRRCRSFGLWRPVRA